MVPSLCRFFDNFKILTPKQPTPTCSSKAYKYDNYDKTKYQFPLLLDPPGKPDHQAIHCPTVNFGPLSSGSVTNSILITGFDTYLTPMSPGAWV